VTRLRHPPFLSPQGLGLSVDPGKPLVAVISRLVPQVTRPPPGSPCCACVLSTPATPSRHTATFQRRLLPLLAPAAATLAPAQKGIHLIEHAVHRTAELGGQFVVLGTGHADGALRGLAGGVFRWAGWPALLAPPLPPALLHCRPAVLLSFVVRLLHSPSLSRALPLCAPRIRPSTSPHQ
jgi:hypothetical protein